jgi:hypothetical protein
MGKELNNFLLGVHMWSTRWEFNNFLLWIHMWSIRWEFNKFFIRNTYTIYKVDIDCSHRLIVLNKLTTQHPIQITTQSTKLRDVGLCHAILFFHAHLFVCLFFQHRINLFGTIWIYITQLPFELDAETCLWNPKKAKIWARSSSTCCLLTPKYHPFYHFSQRGPHLPLTRC